MVIEEGYFSPLLGHARLRPTEKSSLAIDRQSAHVTLERATDTRDLASRGTNSVCMRACMCMLEYTVCCADPTQTIVMGIGMCGVVHVRTRVGASKTRFEADFTTSARAFVFLAGSHSNHIVSLGRNLRAI